MKKPIEELVIFGREGANVVRQHSSPMINGIQTTVGLHTNNMLQLLFLTVQRDFVSLKLIEGIVWHDAAFEQVTSDVIGDVKKENPDLQKALLRIEEDLNKKYGLMPDLNDVDHAILKFVDTLELYIFMLEQHSLGNKAPRTVHIRTRVRKGLMNWLKKTKDYHSYDMLTLIYKIERYHDL